MEDIELSEVDYAIHIDYMHVFIILLYVWGVRMVLILILLPFIEIVNIGYGLILHFCSNDILGHSIDDSI